MQSDNYVSAIIEYADDFKVTERVLWFNATESAVATIRAAGIIVNKNTALGRFRWWVSLVGVSSFNVPTIHIK